MDTQKKTIILNRIANGIYELERQMPYLQMAVKYGLHKGKAGALTSDYFIDRLQELVDALDEYNDPDFTLDDLEDYGKL